MTLIETMLIIGIQNYGPSTVQNNVYPFTFFFLLLFLILTAHVAAAEAQIKTTLLKQY